MIRKPLLIVGIDPGITVGYAFLDINLNVVKIGSKLHFDLNSLIKIVTEYGTPIIVGADKCKSPEIVYKFTTQFGAKLFEPKKDILVRDKNLITSEYEFNDDHQRDALASALFAYKKYESLLNKIKHFVEKNGKQKILDEIIKIVLFNSIPIKTAVQIIEEPEKEEVKIIKKVIKNEHSEYDFFKLYEKFRNLKKENVLLKNYVNKLKKRPVKKEVKIMQDNNVKNKLRYKEQNIQFLAKQIKFQQKEIKRLNELLKYIFSNINNILIVQKLKTHGKVEYLVKGIGKINKKIIEKLKAKETNDLIIINRKDFEKEIKKHNILGKVVEEYKRERREKT